MKKKFLFNYIVLCISLSKSVKRKAIFWYCKYVALIYRGNCTQSPRVRELESLVGAYLIKYILQFSKESCMRTELSLLFTSDLRIEEISSLSPGKVFVWVSKEAY